jgi:sulfotransferase family protein
VDTSKDRLRVRALQKFSSLDVRAIHLVRDVKGVVASRLRRRTGLSVREAARQWARLHQKLEIMLSVLPMKKQMRLRYEDLCEDVPGTLEQVYRFCGVTCDVGPVDFRTVPHHIVGNPMRLDNLSKIRLDERWRTLLTEDQLEEINLVAGPLSDRYGYHRVTAPDTQDLLVKKV